MTTRFDEDGRVENKIKHCVLEKMSKMELQPLDEKDAGKMKKQLDSLIKSDFRRVELVVLLHENLSQTEGFGLIRVKDGKIDVGFLSSKSMMGDMTARLSKKINYNDRKNNFFCVVDIENKLQCALKVSRRYKIADLAAGSNENNRKIQIVNLD
jgi:hypothetical protein